MRWRSDRRESQTTGDAVAIGHLLQLGIERVVGTDHVGVQRDPAHQTSQMGGVERRAESEVLLVEVHAAHVQGAAVEDELPAGAHRDRSHPAVGDVAAQAHPTGVGEREGRPVEVGVIDRPQVRVMQDGDRRRGPRGARGQRGRAEGQRARAVAPAQGHRDRMSVEVAQACAYLDPGRAARAGQQRAHLHLPDVGGVHGAQIDLAQDAEFHQPPVGPGGRSPAPRRLSTRTTSRLMPGRRPVRSSSNGT